jgi:FKBP12-rapamycin complex-associated protein
MVLETLKTLLHLCEQMNLSSFCTCLLRPLGRLLVIESCVSIREDILNTLCVLVLQMGPPYAIFIPFMADQLRTANVESGPNFERYQSYVTSILCGDVLPPVPAPAPRVRPEVGQNVQKDILYQLDPVKFRAVLESTRSNYSSDDWVEWMNRLTVALLQLSPCPALHILGKLSQKHPAVGRELFNVAFMSCWTELHDVYKDNAEENLINLFNSENVPANVLQVGCAKLEFIRFLLSFIIYFCKFILFLSIRLF